MSDGGREDGHNKKQNMKSAQEEELLSQMNANLMIPKINRKPRFPNTMESASRSTDVFPLQHKYIEQVNQNMAQSSNVAQGSKKVNTSKNKRIAIEEVESSKRIRPNLEIVKNDPDMDMNIDMDMDMDILILMSKMETCLDLNSEDAIEM